MIAPPVADPPGTSRVGNMSNVWHRSSHRESDDRGIEVAVLSPHLVAARDSRNPQQPALCLTPASWLSLVEDIKFGALD